MYEPNSNSAYSLGRNVTHERTIALGTTGTASASWSVLANIPLRNTGDGDIVWGANGCRGGGTAVPGFTNSAMAPLSCAAVGGNAGVGDTNLAEDKMGSSLTA